MASAVAFLHHEDGVWGISFPDYPGCISTGATVDEALLRGGQALALHIGGLSENGLDIPAPRSAEDILADPRFDEDRRDAVVAAVPIDLPGRAVRINITMDESLLSAVDRAARATGSSRSGFLAEAARVRLGTVR